MLNGYMGKILRVDLSKKTLKDEILSGELYKKFIGGYGIGARILFNDLKPGIDPLGPDNILGFFSGPLSGTQAISGTRFTIVGKSPLTGCWGDANCGGYFGAYIKFAGYDAVLFNGISDKPVYLFINDGKAEIKDASHIWGKDTYETEDTLKSELGKDVAVACIGPSGEKMALISAIMHDKGHAAARSGLGAVMGSKKLKAVAVTGKMKVPVADENKVKDLRKKYLAQLTGDIENMRKFGTTFVVVHLVEIGDSPVKNWGGIAPVDFPDAKPIGADSVKQHTLKGTACYLCPVGCEAYMKEGTGEYKYAAGCHRPEYETIAMCGSNLLNDNIESIIKLNDICNRYGIDTISTGAVNAFAIECFENGIIKKSDTDGLEMTWGNHRAIVKLTEKIAKREGIGNILADGVKIAAQKINKDANKYAMHIQGQEIPAHNPIADFRLLTMYITDATPGRHTQGSEGMHPEGFIPRFNHQLATGRGKIRKKGVCMQHIVMTSGMCLFVYISLPTADAVLDFMNAVTGWNMTMDELLICGERIANIRQAFNVREGINFHKFEIPNRILGIPPQQTGPLKGITVDKNTLVNEYLIEMDWDLSTAKPSKKKLRELGLEDVIKQIY